MPLTHPVPKPTQLQDSNSGWHLDEPQGADCLCRETFREPQPNREGTLGDSEALAPTTAAKRIQSDSRPEYRAPHERPLTSDPLIWDTVSENFSENLQDAIKGKGKYSQEIKQTSEPHTNVGTIR